MRQTVIAAAIVLVEEKIKQSMQDVKNATQDAIVVPSRMESRYDSTREEYSTRAAAFQRIVDDLKLLKAALQELLKMDSSGDKVEIGSIIVYRINDTESQMALILPQNGGGILETPVGEVLLISKRSPIGAEMLKHQEGDVFIFKTPDGDKQNIVLEKVY